MPQAKIENADKNIVERRRKGNLARKSLRDPRTEQADSLGNPNAFRDELLRRHARVQWQYKYALIFAVLIASWVGRGRLDDQIIAAWTGGALSVTLLGLLAAYRFLKIEDTRAVVKKWTAIFNVIQVAYGIVWAILLTLFPLGADNNIVVTTVAFAGTTVMMGLSLLSANNLRFGVLMSSLPFALVVAARLGFDGDMAHLALAVVLLGTCLFFEHLGSEMRLSWVNHLQSEVVRDQLIVDLEAATAISDEARRRAEEANLAKSRFLATMSHELRTPLNAILGFSEVMSNEVMGPLNNEHYKEYVTDIHSSGSHLLNLINEILDLSRVEAGRYEMNEEPVSLIHAAEESQQMMKLKANQKRISIIMQLQPDLPEINADARAVRQIILNLLSNALKFTPEGGSVWMKVGWTAGGGQYISITDSGPGIPEEEIPVVLSSFGQGSIAIKSAEQGTGLGLPIVQALVHMHEGHFELKSKLREGTEVIATFPRSRVLETMLPGQAANMHRPSSNQAFAQTRQNVSAPPIVSAAGAPTSQAS